MSQKSFDEKRDGDVAVNAVDPANAWDPEATNGGLQRGLKNRHSKLPDICQYIILLRSLL